MSADTLWHRCELSNALNFEQKNPLRGHVTYIFHESFPKDAKVYLFITLLTTSLQITFDYKGLYIVLVNY